MLLKFLVRAFVAEANISSYRAAFPHFIGSLRALRDSAGSRQAVETLRAAGAERWLRTDEHFFHIRHRFYLSQRLSPSQRLACVLHHYRYEMRQFRQSYRRQVYGGPGLLLWQASVDGHTFRVRLAASVETRWEGDLSVELFVDDVRLHIMSFAYVDGALFGLKAQPILFITRNQTHRVELGQGHFRAAFKHTVPPYFCLAAVAGIATANGMSRVAAVRHDAQVACTPKVAGTLKNSYEDFWRAFQATEVEGQVSLLPVPIATTPLSEVKAKHRKRASDRRAAWAEVTNSSHDAIFVHLATPPAAAESVGSDAARAPVAPPRMLASAVAALAGPVSSATQAA